MPVFDYACPKCKKEQHNLLKKFTDVVNCWCGYQMIKIISSPAWHFKQPGGTDKGRLMQIAKWKDKRLRNK